METMIAVIISAAAVTVMTMGNAEHTFDCTNGAADTGTDDASDCAAYGAGDPVAFVGAFLRAAHDALSVAGLRKRQQREQEGGGREQQTAGQTGRQWRGSETGFVHLRSQGWHRVDDEERMAAKAACRGRPSSMPGAAEWLRVCDELSAL